MKKVTREDIDRIDVSGIFSKLAALPEQLRRGWQTALDARLTVNQKNYDVIFLCGMGGSAIGGDLLSLFMGPDLKTPFLVNRDYRLPPSVTGDSLCIASSYSGNTEETLSAVNDALELGCDLVCLSSGGELTRIAKEQHAGIAVLPGGYPPRSALGFSLGALLGMFEPSSNGRIEAGRLFTACDNLELLAEKWTDPDHGENLPLRIAQQAAGDIPLICSDVQLQAVGMRWKAQCNENADTHAFYQPLPEMNHNEIVGWHKMDATKGFFSSLQMILLRSSFDHPRISRRMDITRKVVERAGGQVQEIVAEGEALLDQALYLVYLGDLMSYYLAVLYGVDPSEIKNIDFLKSEMSKK